MPRIVIGGPTRDSGPASFAVDLAELYAYTVQYSGGAVYLRFVRSTYIHVGRERVLEEALRLGATHLLWLDTDMGFPLDAALRLLAHDRPFVACNYVTRDGEHRATAVKDGRPVETTEISRGLEAVDGCGFGVALMQTAIVDTMPRPWFRHGVTEYGGDIGEDLMFCRAVRAAGETVWIDHDLSKEIAHVGQHRFSHHGARALVGA